MDERKNRIWEFIVGNFLFGDDAGLEDGTSFFEEKIIDSTGVLEIIMFMEEEFSIKVEDDELIPENLDSINNLTAFISKKLEKIQLAS